MEDVSRPLVLAGSTSGWARLIGRLADLDLRLVRAASKSAKAAGLGSFAVAFTKLGNGWAYPVIGAAVFIRWGAFGIRIILAALATTALLHSFYPGLKRRFRRERPYIADIQLECLGSPLDRYSFPSGHCMTFTGILVPVIVYWHAALPAGIVMGVCLAWARLATAHHYLSDVVVGGLMGVAVGYPLAALGSRLL